MVVSKLRESQIVNADARVYFVSDPEFSGDHKIGLIGARDLNSFMMQTMDIQSFVCLRPSFSCPPTTLQWWTNIFQINFLKICNFVKFPVDCSLSFLILLIRIFLDEIQIHFRIICIILMMILVKVNL